MLYSLVLFLVVYFPEQYFEEQLFNVLWVGLWCDAVRSRHDTCGHEIDAEKSKDTPERRAA